MNKYFKWAVVSLFALILVYAGLRIYLNKMLKSIVIAQVEQLADNNYELDIGNIDIGWWAFNANIQKIKLRKIYNEKSGDYFHFTISAAQIRLKGLHLFDLLFNHQLELKNVVIYNPTILIEYNDTIIPKPTGEKSLDDFYIKLSKIEMRNALIEIKKSSGEKIKLNSRLLSYDIKKGMLQLAKTTLTGKGSSKRDFDFSCRISKAKLQGFDLNVLINESNFRYSSCSIDSVAVAFETQKNALNKKFTFNDTTTKKRIKPNFIIHPIQIKHIQFHNHFKDGTISASANIFEYSKNQLQLNEIKLAIKEQNSVQAIIKQIVIKEFDADEFFERQHTFITNMTLVHPVIKVIVSDNKNNAEAKADWKYSSDFSIDSILNFEIINGELSLTHQTQKNLKLQVNAVNLKANNVNPLFNKNLSTKNLVSNLTLQIGETYLNFPNNRYHLTLKKASYNLHHEIVTANDLRIVPNYKKNKFHAIVKKQIAMVDLDLKTLFANGFNINDLINNHRIKCNEINAKQLVVNFYKDKNIPLLANDFKKLPQELIHDLKYPIQVKTLHVNDAALISEILNPGAKHIALIRVDQVQSTFNHIDNQLYAGNTIEVKFEGRIASSGLLRATAILDMYAKDFRHTVHAEISTMPFKNLNEFMFDFAGIEIKSGTLDKAVLDIKGNNKKTKCNLDLIYHDLNMVVLRNQNPNKKTYRAIASIVANVLIYNHNPEPGRPLRRSKVEQEYISNKFIIGNWISTSLKALVLTTAPTAANALQIESSSDENSPSNENKKPNLLNRLLGRKKIK